MWIGDAIYFASDRDGTLNLYAYGPGTGAVAQLTNSTTWDVRWPSSDNVSRIVYELDGELHVLDVRTKADQALQIFVPNDGVAMRPARASAEKQIEDFELSPKGERALVVARGDIFTLPVEKGPTRNLTNSSNAHDKWARWSPDGKRIAFLSDRSGEDEVWLVDQAGGKPEPITSGGQAMRYAPEWSAEGTHLAFSDKDGKLYVVTLADKKTVQVADDPRGMIRDYAWSPKGAYLAFSMNDASRTRSLHIWSASDGQAHRVTDDVFNEYAPSWSPDAEQLYYLSERQFAPQISQVEWNFAGARMTGLFALTLKKDGKSPFPPQSDEVTFGDKKDEAKGEAAGEKKDEKAGEAKAEPQQKETPFRVDFDGLASRVTRVPVEPDNYQAVVATKDYLIYVRDDAFFYGREPRTKPSLVILSLKDRKESTLAEGIAGWAVSRDGSKVLVRIEDALQLLDVKPDAKEKKTVSTKGRCWTECLPRSGRRSSTKSGGATGTSSTWRTCTATTGKRSGSVTVRCCRT